MHEASLMQHALNLATRQALQAGARSVDSLRLRVGVLSGVVPEALRFAFDALSPGTLSEGARLEIVTIPATGWCERCDAEFDASDLVQECPRCHEICRHLRCGLEMELESMEIS